MPDEHNAQKPQERHTKHKVASLPPPTVNILCVRCPVPYCNSEPDRKCCNRGGYTLAVGHRQRFREARLLTLRLLEERKASDAAFFAHVKKVAAEVDQWPAWKRKIFG